MGLGMMPAPIQGLPPSPSTATVAIEVPVGTSDTVVATYTPPAEGGVIVLASLDVSASATVTVWVAFTDAAGQADTLYLTQQSASVSAGTYSLLPAVFVASADPVTLYAVASVAGAVSASSAVWQFV